MKREYYCLVAGLPDLFFNEDKTALSSIIFRNEIKHQLNNSDFELVKLLFLHFDNENLLTLLFNQNMPFNTNGNYPQEFLENQIINPVEIPEYIIHFIKWIKQTESHELNLHVKNKLQSLFYEHLVQTKNTFLSEWFKFTLNIKNILTAKNCNRFGYNQEKHLIPVFQCDTVYNLLLQNRLKPEYFEEVLPFADQIFRISESNINIEEKEKAVDKIKWDYLDEQTFFHFFTIEKVLTHIIKLNIIERWMKLDAETGKVLLNKLIEELKLSYTFPEEFSTVK